jgi:acyl-CoA thioesterase I
MLVKVGYCIIFFKIFVNKMYIYVIKYVFFKNHTTHTFMAGMQAPPNMGNEYTRQFAAIFPKLAKQYKAQLIPFLLKDVAAISSLNLADGKHPNVEGQKIVRDNVWDVLNEIL